MKLLKSMALLCVFSVGIPFLMSSARLNATVNAAIDQESVLLMSSYQSTVKWKSSKEFKVLRKNGGSTDTYKANEIYTGMPYTQITDKKIGEFLDCCTYQNGKAYLSYITDQKTLELKSTVLPANGGYWNFGNDCSTAVTLAWSTCYPEIKYSEINTETFLTCAKNGSYSTYHLKTVGGYKTGNISSTKDYCVDKSTNQSRHDAVIGYYRAMVKGDSLFYRKPGQGHALLVISVSGNGVRVTEQCGLSGKSSWKTNKYYSFEDLYNKGYLPISCTNIARY